MRELKNAILLILLLSNAFWAPHASAAGGKNTGFAYAVTRTQFQNPVEQQTQGGATQPDRTLWVTNPLIPSCVWDADDQLYTQGSGSLAPGQTVTIKRCIVGDMMNHLAITNMAVSRGTVSVVMTETGLPVAVPVRISNGFGSACIMGPGYPWTSNELLPIPNSGYGGIGAITEVTWQITNTGTKTAIISISTNLDIAWSPYYLQTVYSCPGYDPATEGYYPPARRISGPDIYNDPAFYVWN